MDLRELKTYEIARQLSGLNYFQLSDVLTQLSMTFLRDRNQLKDLNQPEASAALNQAAYDVNHAAIELEKAIKVMIK